MKIRTNFSKDKVLNHWIEKTKEKSITRRHETKYEVYQHDRWNQIFFFLYMFVCSNIAWQSIKIIIAWAKTYVFMASGSVWTSMLLNWQHLFSTCINQVLFWKLWLFDVHKEIESIYLIWTAILVSWANRHSFDFQDIKKKITTNVATLLNNYCVWNIIASIIILKKIYLLWSMCKRYPLIYWLLNVST